MIYDKHHPLCCCSLDHGPVSLPTLMILSGGHIRFKTAHHCPVWLLCLFCVLSLGPAGETSFSVIADMRREHYLSLQWVAALSVLVSVLADI